MAVGGVARGGLFLFIGSAVVAVLGYVYWFLISIFVGTEAVGIASSVYSLSTLLSGFAVLGVPVGVQRFLGRSFNNKDIESLSTYYWSSFVFVLVTCLCSAIVIWLIAILSLPFLGFSECMLFMTGLISLFSFYAVATALFSSVVRTEYAAASMVGSGVIRVCSGVFLVYLGFGWLGASIGLLSENVSLTVLMFIFSRRTLKRLGSTERHVRLGKLHEPLHAGLVNWLPGIVALCGQQLSFLVVFGIQGSSQAGMYYIAYVVFALVNMLPASLMSILFPVLSGLTSEQGKGIAWSILKISLALACPSAAFLMLYPTLPLSFMGGSYIQAASTVSILTLSIIPLTLVSAVYSFVYASGSYRKVIGIGLAMNLPRVILYFLLVPIYGGEGAALAFLAGALTGLLGATVISRMVHFRASLGKIAIAIVTPFMAALLCYVIGLGWLFGGIVILMVSILSYGRLGVVERTDLVEIARAFASEKRVAKVGERLHWLLKIIYGG